MNENLQLTDQNTQKSRNLTILHGLLIQDQIAKDLEVKQYNRRTFTMWGRSI